MHWKIMRWEVYASHSCREENWIFHLVPQKVTFSDESVEELRLEQDLQANGTTPLPVNSAFMKQKPRCHGY